MITHISYQSNNPIIGKNLPEQAGIKAIVGRDILDNYKICFNGVSEELEIEVIR